MADYTCDVCGRTFSSRDEYERHMRATHPGSTRGETSPQGAHIDIGMVGEPTDEADIVEREDVIDTESVSDTSQVRPPRSSSEDEGRREIEVGDWMMGQNDDVLRRSSRSELPAFRCSYCGAEFNNEDELTDHIDTAHKRGELTA